GFTVELNAVEIALYRCEENIVQGGKTHCAVQGPSALARANPCEMYWFLAVLGNVKGASGGYSRASRLLPFARHGILGYNSRGGSSKMHRKISGLALAGMLLAGMII